MRTKPGMGTDEIDELEDDDNEDSGELSVAWLENLERRITKRIEKSYQQFTENLTEQLQGLKLENKPNNQNEPNPLPAIPELPKPLSKDEIAAIVKEQIEALKLTPNQQRKLFKKRQR